MHVGKNEVFVLCMLSWRFVNFCLFFSIYNLEFSEAHGWFQTIKPQPHGLHHETKVSTRAFFDKTPHSIKKVPQSICGSFTDSKLLMHGIKSWENILLMLRYFEFKPCSFLHFDDHCEQHQQIVWDWIRWNVVFPIVYNKVYVLSHFW